MELRKFFRDLCAKVICVTNLDRLQYDIIFILCKLEKKIPPTLFYAMVHLFVHLSYEAKIVGPITWLDVPYKKKLENLEMICKKQSSS